MSIIRVVHNKDNPFVQINKEALRNPRLSLKAVGLWARCLSRPDDWEFSVENLAKEGKEKKLAIYNAIDELIEEGYVVKIEAFQKREDGKFSDKVVHYLFFEFVPEEPEKQQFIEKFKKCFRDRGFGDLRNQPVLIQSKTNTEKKKKSGNSAPPRTATTSKIGFNAEERKFTGITESDLKAWREKFTGLNLDKELALCAEWALTTRRDNYRKSILTWLRNVQNSRSERQFAPAAGAPAQPVEVIVSKEDIMTNRTLAAKWEDGSIGMLPHLYKICATPTKIQFSLPGWSFELEYDMPTSEFLKLSKPALKKMRLI